MKLKQRPEDFVVEEVDRVTLGEGPFAVYRLSKKGIGTIEAVGRIAREFGVPKSAIGFGGLKDKWAATAQKVSIEGGPRRSLATDRFELRYLGRSAEPVARHRFDRNRFTIVVRDLWDGDIRHLKSALKEIRTDGLPNYFDSQRFGSSKGSDDFIARRLLKADMEGAVKLALATPTSDDRGPAKRVKKILFQNWGRWEECVKALPAEARVVKLLARGDWAKAFGTIDRRLRLLYASAYQSFLWNRVLEKLLRANVAASQLFRKAYAMGELVFYHRLPAKQRERFLSLKIPLVRRGVTFAEPEVEQATLDVVKNEGFGLKDLKIKEGTYFGRGERAAVFLPQDVSLAGPEPDELNAKKLKATLAFELPKGCYATILIKRIFH